MVKPLWGSREMTNTDQHFLEDVFEKGLEWNKQDLIYHAEAILSQLQHSNWLALDTLANTQTFKDIKTYIDTHHWSLAVSKSWANIHFAYVQKLMELYCDCTDLKNNVMNYWSGSVTLDGICWVNSWLLMESIRKSESLPPGHWVVDEQFLSKVFARVKWSTETEEETEKTDEEVFDTVRAWLDSEWKNFDRSTVEGVKSVTFDTIEQSDHNDITATITLDNWSTTTHTFTEAKETTEKSNQAIAEEIAKKIETQKRKYKKPDIKWKTITIIYDPKTQKTTDKSNQPQYLVNVTISVSDNTWKAETTTSFEEDRIVEEKEDNEEKEKLYKETTNRIDQNWRDANFDDLDGVIVKFSDKPEPIDTRAIQDATATIYIDWTLYDTYTFKETIEAREKTDQEKVNEIKQWIEALPDNQKREYENPYPDSATITYDPTTRHNNTKNNKTYTVSIIIRIGTIEQKLSFEESPIKIETTNPMERSFEITKWTVEIWKPIERLSWKWATTRPIYFTDKFTGNKKQIWSIVKCEAKETNKKSWVMFLSSKRSEWLFDKEKNWDTFPNTSKINNYLKSFNPPRDFTMMSTWPTFLNENENTMSWLNYDNWEKVGNDTSIKDWNTNNRWIAYISWKKMTLSHTQEMTDEKVKKLIDADADITTMSSWKRNWKINTNASLRQHKNTHSIVQFDDGKTWEIIINNFDDPKSKQEIYIWLEEIERALYADSDRANDYLDQIWINTDQWIQNSNPMYNDIFTDPKKATSKEYESNMPWVFIRYTYE